ncbi:MAG TPA: hypothetical protein VJA16_24595 [Thermoanaerobaculia bacterium]
MRLPGISASGAAGGTGGAGIADGAPRTDGMSSTGAVAGANAAGGMSLAGAVGGACMAGLVLAAGVVLRFWNLGGQVLGGDELHAVRAALSQPLPALLTTYQLADSCIPLTALDRWLLDHGVALDEWLLRLPVLASGLAALVLLPLLVRRRLPPGAWTFFGALVATSPLLVLYSRIARSYMPATLLSFAAVMAFDCWWTPVRAGSPARASGARAADARRGTAAAIAYVVLAALAMWFHLGTAPIVVAPLLFGAGELALGRESRGWPWRRLAALGAAAAGLAAGCALFLVPAYPSLARLIAAKRQPQEVPAATWWGVLQLQAGARAGQRLPALLFWAAALAGLAVLLRRRRRLGIYLLALVLAQVLGILALSPLGLARLQVLDRYLLPALPVVLLWVAAGLADPWWPRQGRLGRAGQWLGAAGLVLAWLSAGPFADAGFRASSFMHHNDMVAFALPRATAPPGGVPRPYLALGGPPGSTIVELPWPPVWDFGRCFYVYQEVHGLRVRVAAAAGAPPAERLRLRNRVSAEPAALLASGARWVVVHRDLAMEEERLELPAGAPPPRRMPPSLAAELAAMGERSAARFAAAWGPPAFADAAVAVWDLARVRKLAN